MHVKPIKKLVCANCLKLAMCNSKLKATDGRVKYASIILVFGCLDLSNQVGFGSIACEANVFSTNIDLVYKFFNVKEEIKNDDGEEKEKTITM